MIGKISDTANSAVVCSPRYARGDRLELPDWLCPRSALRVARSPEGEEVLVDSGSEPFDSIQMVSNRVVERGRQRPQKSQKTALEIVKDRFSHSCCRYPMLHVLLGLLAGGLPPSLSARTGSGPLPKTCERSGSDASLYRQCRCRRSRRPASGHQNRDFSSAGEYCGPRLRSYW